MYLILTQSLPDGKYKTHGKYNWHERLRIKIIKWLYSTISKNDDFEITTTSGVR